MNWIWRCRMKNNHVSGNCWRFNRKQAVRTISQNVRKAHRNRNPFFSLIFMAGLSFPRSGDFRDGCHPACYKLLWISITLSCLFKNRTIYFLPYKIVFFLHQYQKIGNWVFTENNHNDHFVNLLYSIILYTLLRMRTYVAKL